MQRKLIWAFIGVKNYPHAFSDIRIHPFSYYLGPKMITIDRLLTGVFLLLLCGAAYFFLERMLFLDASFIVFRIINLDSLQIQEHRYGSFITQGVPLLAARMNLPIGLILFLYSISFNLFYLVVVLLLLFRFREKELALLMSFYFLLFVSDTYFWTNNEVHQGITWMFLFFGFILFMGKRKKPLWFIIPFFLILSFLAIFTHPLVVFPLVFLWLFLVFSKEWPYQRNLTLLFTIFLSLIIYLKFSFSTGSSSFYDAEKMHSATHLSFKKIFSAFTSPMAKEILLRSLWNYWLVPILFLAGLWTAFQHKKWFHFLLVLVFSGGYFVAICITFPNFIPFYTESEWMPGTILFTALFVYYTLPGMRYRNALLLLIFIFGVRLAYIIAASEKWVERKEWTDARLEEMRQRNIYKGLIVENDTINKKLFMHWGSPTESILASALSGDIPQRTFVIGTKKDLESRKPSHPDHMIAPFDIITNQQLNKNYFQLDTTTLYQFVR